MDIYISPLFLMINTGFLFGGLMHFAERVGAGTTIYPVISPPAPAGAEGFSAAVLSLDVTKCY